MEKKKDLIGLRHAIEEQFPNDAYYFPTSPSDAQSRLQRWSDTGVSAPLAIITPASEDELRSILRIVRDHRDSHHHPHQQQQIIVAGGKCAWFVPVDGEKVYLSLSKLNHVGLDTDAGTVTVGGGATVGDVMEVCRGYEHYTFLAVLNAIGFVGSVIGGGFSSFNGIHGFAVDNVVSMSVITANGQSLVLDHQSQGEEAGLFAALRGAGQGLGIVTSITLKAWSVSDLGMTDDKVWTRKLVFPASEIMNAAKAFCNVKPHERLTTSLMFVKPGGAVLVVLSASFLGSSKDAERVATPLLQPELEKHTLSAETGSIVFHDMNKGKEALGEPRQQKEMYTCVIRETDPDSIVEAFKHYSEFVQSNEEAKRSYTFIGQWSTARPIQRAPQDHQDFVAMRDRGILVQATAWYPDEALSSTAHQFGTSVIEAMRKVDTINGLPARILAHNPRFGHDLTEAYTDEMIRVRREVKKTWDPNNLFWGPLDDAAHFVKPPTAK